MDGAPQTIYNYPENEIALTSKEPLFVLAWTAVRPPALMYVASRVVPADDPDWAVEAEDP